MPFKTTPLEGLLIFEPRVFEDSRGYFYESYNTKTFREAGIETTFVQDNQAASTKGVLRGLHQQTGHASQTKLVRVISGEVFDVTVDLRPDSPTYHQWYGIYLSGENHRQLYIPRGFAHGYLVTSEEATFVYKCDNFYAPETEQGFRYDDPAFGVEWPKMEGGYTVADRDHTWPLANLNP
ncbi:dTDP-4-dehydrorhamnose 3,5-epimerase [Lewinella aquimaris]|uniref:dTDP-4-dehydrorhamnose 3,5-epimerase n=1 Tax=Neolewinella aquimaris TaxID=1835722 RepID=A0A840EH73_9BACT|nr:dTDP-4-dehydrorhamnose 3,5-epimerase [Neolewinella aquimaris]MBB4080256.1 dTDP-4-dehydrorhamnose 3,5-epimerase [Neolewinella aquimaris]